MPTKREREYYRMGYEDGRRGGFDPSREDIYVSEYAVDTVRPRQRPKKRKLSAWNKFVKANAKKPRFRLRSGSPNLKKLGVAFRKTPAGKKKRR